MNPSNKLSHSLAFSNLLPLCTRSLTTNIRSTTFIPARFTTTTTTPSYRMARMAKKATIKSTAAPAAAVTTNPPTTPSTTFRKYHGLGNDFILIDNRHTTTPILTAEQSARLCDRNKGVGADGVIFLLPPQTPNAHCSMRLYNSDGSEPEMCGNGIRCLARFAVDMGIIPTDGALVVDTLAGVIVPHFVPGSPLVSVDMGEPILNAEDVPTRLQCTQKNNFVDTLIVNGKSWPFTAVSMGNPHAVTFVDKDVYQQVDEELESIGPLVTDHDFFPAKTNSEFVYAVSNTELDMVVWERGAGRTMACGTGACAVLVAAVLTGRAEKDTKVTVHLPGGDLIIEWVSKTNHVLMTGPAELVFEGKLADV